MEKVLGYHRQLNADAYQGNNRFWNPNPLGLGGKTALVN